MTLNSLCSGK